MAFVILAALLRLISLNGKILVYYS